MNDPHRRERLISFSLVAILLLLAACSIGATLIIRHASLQASEAVHMSDLYEQVHYLVSTEDASLNEYTVAPDPQTLAEFRASTQHISATLEQIIHDGDTSDRAFVRLVQPLHARYLLLVDRYVRLVDAHQHADALALYQDKITPLFDGLSQQIGAAAQLDHQLAVQSLAASQRTQTIVILFTVLAFVVGLFLLVVFWRVMHGYRRQFDASTQMELQRREQAALIDPLTSLLNHGAIIKRIEAELRACHHSQRNCAILFVDVDHFKHINDTWGHGAGDAALCTVGQRLRQGIRQQDCVGRYGGEEFAILLSDIEQHQAMELAERLRDALAEHPCVWKQEETGSVVEIVLTASFGLATYPLDGITCKQLVETADAAMYQAKHSGRNRVCLPEHLEENQALSQGSEQNVLEVLTTMAALHDQQTQQHANRMIHLAEATMRVLGRSEQEIVLLRLAAQLHDIGKVGVPEAILHKPGPLTQEEWAVMRRHPQIGQHILTQAKGQFGLVSHIIVAHHERFDGQGYPYGLAGEEIPLGARLLSVIDAYDAMTSDRPYRQALSGVQAQEELRREAGKQFDPHVVEAFLQVLQEHEPQANNPALSVQIGQ